MFNLNDLCNIKRVVVVRFIGIGIKRLYKERFCFFFFVYIKWKIFFYSLFVDEGMSVFWFFID